MYRIWLFILLISNAAQAQLQLAKIFTDDMVLQRNKPVPVWGKYIPGYEIKVSIGRDTKMTVADHDSSWRVVLSPQRANANPQSLVIFTKSDTIVLKNLLIGDLWVCIGQSNMEWPMIKERHFKEEIDHSCQPLMRFFNPVYAGKNIFGTTFTDSVVQFLTQHKFYKGKWQHCDSTTFKTMSAVAYYFGKEIVNNISVPVGLINLSIGGAPLETFIAKDALENSKIFWKKAKGDWLSNNALPVWIRERGLQNIGARQDVATDENGKNHGFKPGFAYAAGIEPLLAMPVKGILCYQGESNAQEAERVNEYAMLSKLMVDDYRVKWNDPKLPFYFVQLSSIDTAKYKGHLWPEFRDEQRKMLQLIEYSGIAVSSDIGARHDVHPTNKKSVGERLSRWALCKTYKKKLLPSGPMPVRAVYRKKRVLIRFRFTGKKLITMYGQLLRGFSLNGKDDAIASIQRRHVEIRFDRKPEYVYYGWKPFSDGNLFNSENLPASTFKIRVK